MELIDYINIILKVPAFLVATAKVIEFIRKHFDKK